MNNFLRVPGTHALMLSCAMLGSGVRGEACGNGKFVPEPTSYWLWSNTWCDPNQKCNLIGPALPGGGLVCARSGCQRPPFNNRQGGHCSKRCRALDRGEAPPSSPVPNGTPQPVAAAAVSHCTPASTAECEDVEQSGASLHSWSARAANLGFCQGPAE